MSWVCHFRFDLVISDPSICGPIARYFCFDHAIFAHIAHHFIVDLPNLSGRTSPISQRPCLPNSFSVSPRPCDFWASSSSFSLRHLDFFASLTSYFRSYLAIFASGAGNFHSDLEIFGPVPRHFRFLLWIFATKAHHFPISLLYIAVRSRHFSWDLANLRQ